MPGNLVLSILLLTILGAFAPSCFAAPAVPSAILADTAEFTLGQQCTDRKQFTSAVKHFNNAVRTEPTNVRYHYARGVANLGLRDADGALGDFQFCKKTDPSFVIPAKCWAAAYRACGESKQSIEWWTKALVEEPKRTRYDIYFQRAQTLVEADEYEKAIADYSAAIALYPRIDDFYAQRAQCYAALKQYAKAIAYYDTRIKRDFRDDGCFMHRAGCYLGLKQYNRAIADYTSAISLKPRAAKYYALRAKAYDCMGDNVLAEKDRAMSRQLGEEFKL